MAGPWEKYQTVETGPWQKYAQPQTQEQPGLSQRIDEDLSKRGQEVGQTLQQAGVDLSGPITIEKATKFIEKAGGVFLPGGLPGEGIRDIYGFITGQKELTPGETKLQIVGKGVAGSLFDIVGNVATSAVTSLAHGVSFITPDSVEKPVVESTMAGLKWLKDSIIGQKAIEAAQQGMKGWETFKTENPRAAKDIESSVNISLMFAPTKVKANAKPSVIGQTAEALDKRAARQAFKKKVDFVQELVMPRETSKIAREQVGRTEVSGIFGSKKVIPTAREQEVAKEVLRIKNISPYQSLQKNYNIIRDYNQNLAKQLRYEIGKRRTFITNNNVTNEIDNSISQLSAESPFLIGENSKIADRISNQAKKFIDEEPPTPTGLLNARQRFDSWILDTKGKRGFGGANEFADTAFSESANIIRRTMNEKIMEYAPSARVRTGLRRQSNLYKAMDNLGDKAALEAKTAVGRLVQNAAKTVGLRNKLAQEIGLTLGFGGLTTIAYFAPYFTAGMVAGGIGLGSAKMLMSSQAKRTISNILKLTDKAILTSKNPSMIKQLRADRALVKEMIMNTETTDEK